MGDLKQFQKRFIALRHVMYDDGIARGLPLHKDDLRVLAERLANEGTSFIKVTIPLLGKALDLGLVSGTFACPAHFRVKRDTRLPLFMYSVFSQVFDDEGALLAKPSVESIAFLRQFLLFDGKLIFEPTPIMKEQAVSEFSDRMRLLRKVKIPTDHPVLRRAQQLIGRALAYLDLSDITPGHGPGAVAERLDKFGRWDFKTWPVKAERFYPLSVYGRHSLRALMEQKFPSYTRESVTRCCLVPKDFKGPRLISAEHVVNQYLQQGQMKALMRYIANHGLLRKSIRLRDQTFNQIAAREAHDNCHATVDLSAASDTVSVTLVWYLFKLVPKIRRRLMATRSDYMRYADRKIKITAFAPMGSATCFPVETLVFWAISMASVELTRLHPKTGKPVSDLNAIAQVVRVFGDDIILPEEALPTLAATLQSVGCSVNQAKTCYKTPFRESCGTEWFGRYDVSIIRNRSLDYGRHDVVVHPVICDLQRKFFSRGYFITAALLSEWANEIWPTPRYAISSYIPQKMYYDLGILLPSETKAPSKRLTADLWGYLGYFEREALDLDKFGGVIGWDSDIPIALPVRFNRDYQRAECRLPRPFQKSREWIHGGYPRLLARLLQDQTDRIALRDLRVRRAWTYMPRIHGFHH